MFRNRERKTEYQQKRFQDSCRISDVLESFFDFKFCLRIYKENLIVICYSINGKRKKGSMTIGLRGR